MSNALAKRQEAEDLFAWGAGQNPGAWVDHSKTAARAAQTIAIKCGMDKDAAYTMGLLHDIGRYKGAAGLRHIYTGYRLLTEKGFDRNARICLTHSFPTKDIEAFNGNIDCTANEIKYLQTELEKNEFDDYDKLIQLSDAISLARGVCIMEVRLVDVARRYKTLNKKIIDKWNAYFDIKAYFDAQCGINIYKLFLDEIINIV